MLSYVPIHPGCPNPPLLRIATFCQFHKSFDHSLTFLAVLAYNLLFSLYSVVLALIAALALIAVWLLSHLHSIILTFSETLLGDEMIFAT